MLANIKSSAVIGHDGVVVEVEVDTRGGLPGVVIVGLLDAAVQESRERVQSAIKNARLPYPRKRIIVNLAPASIRKAGPIYDLPIAIGILVAAEALPPDALDGSLRHISGVLPEFGSRVLETMRQPIEDKVVTISRAPGTLIFPASFQLVAAMNPCPCGNLGSPVKACTCSHNTVTCYQKRISGPLLNRIDIHVEVPFVDFEKLGEDRLGEPSESIRQRVETARQCQLDRLSEDGLLSNADMGVEQVRKYCQLDTSSKSVLESAMRQLHLSARGYHRVLKLTRMIADLNGDETITPAHLAEALQYRANQEH